MFRGHDRCRVRRRSGDCERRRRTYLWKVGEKRFFKSFCLEPPFFTALAAFVALALASSVGDARRETGGAGVSFPRTAMTENGARGTKRLSRGESDEGESRRGMRAPRTLSHVCCRDASNGVRCAD
jgi:hypothetical protein